MLKSAFIQKIAMEPNLQDNCKNPHPSIPNIMLLKSVRSPKKVSKRVPFVCRNLKIDVLSIKKYFGMLKYESCDWLACTVFIQYI